MKSKTLPRATLVLKHVWNAKLPPLKVEMEAKSPKGACIGGSSALSIALFRAVEAMKKKIDGTEFLSETDLVRTVQDIETRLIWSPTGCQDYWGAVRGRLNVINYKPGAVQVTTVTAAQLDKLEERIVLCYSGKSRDSSLNNWAIFKRVFDGDKQMVQSLNTMGEIAEKAAASALKGDWDSLISYSQEEWHLRKQLWPDIATAETEKIDSLAKSFGATFSRVCGAGGGGVVAVLCDASKKASVLKKLTEQNVQILSTGIARTGLEVSYGK
jgi:D-glycero-alpha-D-manno-heptose-7-phosphate kinase